MDLLSYASKINVKKLYIKIIAIKMRPRHQLIINDFNIIKVEFIWLFFTYYQRYPFLKKTFTFNINKIT